MFNVSKSRIMPPVNSPNANQVSQVLVLFYSQNVPADTERLENE